MKITMGVDSAERAAVVADMIRALRFAEPRIDVVHVTESWEEAPYSSVARQKPDLLSRYFEMIDSEAKSLLSNVKGDLLHRQFTEVSTHHFKGFITNRLLKHADDTNADLVAIASSGKGPIGGIILGSVARKAAVASKRSVLVVKRPPSQARPLTVVLATDHSAYSHRCVEEFRRWGPRGIGRLVVTTVYPEELVRALGAAAGNLKADVAGWLGSELEAANQKLCSRLQALGAECTSRVETGSVGDSLARVMEEEQADLLVLGAQGHGFLDRLTLGSVSFQQVVKRPYSVVIVRV